MGMPLPENRRIAVMPVGAAVARILLLMPIHTIAARRFCTPPKNEAACVVSPARLGSLGRPCPVGSKKRSSASALPDNLARPGSRGPHFHDAGTERTDGSFVLNKALSLTHFGMRNVKQIAILSLPSEKVNTKSVRPDCVRGAGYQATRADRDAVLL